MIYILVVPHVTLVNKTGPSLIHNVDFCKQITFTNVNNIPITFVATSNLMLMVVSRSDYLSIKENQVLGRYVTPMKVSKIIKKFPKKIEVKEIGTSVQERPIHSLGLGLGPTKILMWSQMHGNESTTTKAVLDLLNFMVKQSEVSRSIYNECTLLIIPMLNPDGAQAYTRVNANGIDLNRDAQSRSQPESVILRKVFDEFKPDYCFNLHDQRTIFNVGKSNKPATVSFLAPACDEARSISTAREISMKLIVAMNLMLQKMIPGQIGRYDDAFNSNCVGDTFQMLGIPTLLFESGHFPGDYQRERTREYIFYAIVTALKTIAENMLGRFQRKDYFEIPENDKLFLDVLVQNVHVINPNLNPGDALGLLFKEALVNNAIEFTPIVDKKGNLKQYFGHAEYDCLRGDDLKELRQKQYWSDLVAL